MSNNKIEFVWKVLTAIWLFLACAVISIDSGRIAKLEKQVEVLSKVAFVSILQNAGNAEAK